MDGLPIIDVSADPGPEQSSNAGAALETTGFSRGRYAFISLGCPKNLVDSERMLGDRKSVV